MTPVPPVRLVSPFSTSTRGGQRGTTSTKSATRFLFVNPATGDIKEEAPAEGSAFVSARSLPIAELIRICEDLERRGQVRTAGRLRVYCAGGV